MNSGQAITAGMRAQRDRDFLDALAWKWGGTINTRDGLQAWLWWGWSLMGNGGLGYPGYEFGMVKDHRVYRSSNRNCS